MPTIPSCSFLAAVVAVAFLIRPVNAQTAAPPGCRLGEILSLPIKMSERENKPTMDATLNGKPARALISLESANTSLMTTGLAALDIPLIRGVERNLARIDKLTVGPFTANGVYSVETSRESSAVSVGADFLMRTDVELSLKDRYIKFFSVENCKSSHLGYWSEDALSIPYHTASERKKSPLIWVKLNGKPVEAMIYSGMGSSILNLEAARRIGITPESEGVKRAGTLHQGEYPTPIYTVQLASFEIGDEKIRHTQLRFADTGYPYLMLGADFLEAHRVLISVSQKKLYFSYVGGPVFSSNYESE